MTQGRLLLVTQYPDERAIYGDALRANGFDVQIADRPEDAYMQVRQQRPDVVVTRVPQAGGAGPENDLLRRLKEDDVTRSVPVVIITSFMQPERRAEAVTAGCDGYLLIPALPDTLVSEVRRILLQRPDDTTAHATG
jgi:two-component system, cell cycle response regulator DivK